MGIDVTKADKGDFIEDLECPKCGASWDNIMNQPALRHRGWNPKSGRLFSCWACSSSVTEAEIETGKSLRELVEDSFADFEAISYSEYTSFEEDT